jgi:hypothetical protein
MISDVVKKRRERIFVDLLDGKNLDRERLRVAMDGPRVNKLLYRLGKLPGEPLFFKTRHGGSDRCGRKRSHYPARLLNESGCLRGSTVPCLAQP